MLITPMQCEIRTWNFMLIAPMQCEIRTWNFMLIAPMQCEIRTWNFMMIAPIKTPTLCMASPSTCVSADLRVRFVVTSLFVAC